VLIKNWFAYTSPVSNFIHRSAVVTRGSKYLKGRSQQECSTLIAR
jgi:hypothetical protein